MQYSCFICSDFLKKSESFTSKLESQPLSIAQDLNVTYKYGFAILRNSSCIVMKVLVAYDKFPRQHYRLLLSI